MIEDSTIPVEATISLKKILYLPVVKREIWTPITTYFYWENEISFERVHVFNINRSRYPQIFWHSLFGMIDFSRKFGKMVPKVIVNDSYAVEFF